MRYFIVETSLNIGDSFYIAGSDANHIKNVLRKKAKDIIGLSDKKGFQYKAVITEILKREVKILIVDKFLSKTESSLNITLAHAVLKEKKTDRLLKSLTELGIVRFIPFISNRCVVKLDKEKSNSRIIRWKKIIDEALKQSGRGEAPRIDMPLSFEDVLNIAGSEYDKKIIFYEEEKEGFDKPDFENHNDINDWFLMIGPEGGFTKEEISLAKDKGFITSTLGPRILRSETAAIAAVAIIQFLYGDMGGKL